MEKYIILDQNNTIEISTSFIDGFISIQLTGEKAVNIWINQNCVYDHDILDSYKNFDIVKAKKGYFISQYFYYDSIFILFARDFKTAAAEWLNTINKLNNK